MTETIADQIDALQRMTTSELVERYAELHGYPCRTRHRAYLIRSKRSTNPGGVRAARRGPRA